MVVTAPAHQQTYPGLRPINLNTDIPGILKLLEVCFGDSINNIDGQRFYTGPATPNQQTAFLWRLNPAASKLALGFVWEVNGRIVGNVTVLTTKMPGRFLVVNVAVHPDQRRKGIAYRLMQAVHDMVQKRNGHEILLQVVKDNTPAEDLYKRLNYTNLGSMTSWYAPVSRLRHLDSMANSSGRGPHIRELRRSEWQAAFQLDQLALSSELNWPEPLTKDAYQNGILRKVTNFVNGRSMETWVTAHNQKLTGMATILSEWGKTHAASLRVHPEWRGELERPLLAKLIRRLYYLPRRNVRIDHPDDDSFTGNLLREANFQPRRTLTYMHLKLD